MATFTVCEIMYVCNISWRLGVNWYIRMVLAKSESHCQEQQVSGGNVIKPHDPFSEL
jgi:hypothetical protein